LANISHDEDQVIHLHLADPTIAINTNLAKFAAPETRYCPAGVYEIIHHARHPPRLQINSQNCVHCKACDIKDPLQNITWTPPEGGSGPQYSDM
jgi:electron-transferring-flavoprotein dehydrogenase